MEISACWKSAMCVRACVCANMVLHANIERLQFGWIEWRKRSTFVVCTSRSLLFDIKSLPWNFTQSPTKSHAIYIANATYCFDTHSHKHTHFMGQSNLKAVDSGELCVYSCILFYQFWIKENPITQISIVSIWCAWFFQPEPATARTISCRFKGDKKFKSITIDNDDLWHLLIRLKISIARLIGYQCDVASEQIKTPSGTAFE